jgi:hypothetical protein
VFVAVAFCAQADVGVPDTPAGHVLSAFFDAFNTADHDRIAAYVKEYDPENNADGLTSFSNQTGGFTLVSIVHSAPDIRALPPGAKLDEIQLDAAIRQKTIGHRNAPRSSVKRRAVVPIPFRDSLRATTSPSVFPSGDPSTLSRKVIGKGRA